MQAGTLLINGHAEQSEASFEVFNPATEAVIARAPACSQAQLDAAVEAAQRAFVRWRGDEAERRAFLRQCAQTIQGHAQELARLLTEEQGKPLAKAMKEVMLSAYWFTLTADMPLPVEVLLDNEKARVELQHVPLGVVAAIAPWNYPLMLAVVKIAPALLAGNTVILKPSPYTPLTLLEVGKLLNEILPPGVFTVLSGGDELGAALTRHAGVRKIAFTGSIETGKKVAEAAAGDLKRVTLELGGNDAAIILPDADLERIVAPLFWTAFENSGQFCSAIKRVYVHADLFTPLTRALSELASSIVVGNGLAPETQLGPLSNRAQFERVISLVDQARARGATILTGGAPLDGPGYFYPPTLVTEIDDSCPLVAEEQFGPALPILVYHDLDDAIERANATPYGLGGSVWSADIARATAVARQLACGTTWVNQHAALLPDIPFGGAKWSGIGVEYGVAGLLEFTQAQVVNIAR